MSIGSKIFLSALVALLSVSVTFAQRDPFTVLQDLGPGFYGILLPFVFTFAIIYALLQYTALAKNDIGKRVTVVVAFVAGLFVTALGGPELAAFFINLFGGAAIILAGILVILLLLALVGWQRDTSKPFPTIVLAVVIVIGIIIFLMSTGTFIDFRLDAQLGSLVFVFIVLIAVAWFLWSAEKSDSHAASPAAAGRPG